MEKHKLAWAKNWVESEKNLYIGGTWSQSRSGKTFKSVNPANGHTLAILQEAGKADVDAAVEAAKIAFQGKDLGISDQPTEWRGLSRRERAARLQLIGKLIREHRAELATLETLDNGKTYAESFNDDLPESADVFDYYAGWIDKIYSENCPVDAGFVNFTRREPIGVCALVVPWNFPLLLACWKMAPALAMGNTIVVKPSPFTSLSLVRLAEILHENNVLPKGVFNLVLGNEECGSALSNHADVAKISFTGSTQVGKKIVEASGRSNLKSVSLELGGKSPNIIFADTPNLDAVIDRGFTAMFCHKGEKCSEPTRFFIEDSIYPRVAARLAQKAQAVICGDPFDEKTQQGPQCHEAHLQKILDYIRIGKEEGATLLAGGEREVTGTNASGYYVTPTIFGDVKNTMRIAQEEIFGPVLVLIRFKTEAEAIVGANDSIYGLAAGVYTQDISRAHRIANALDAGMVFVNHYGCYDFASPFGGVKQSGWGKEMAFHSLEAYTRLKSIWIRY